MKREKIRFATRLFGMGLAIGTVTYHTIHNAMVVNLDFALLIIGGSLLLLGLLGRDEENHVTVKLRPTFQEVFWNIVREYDLGCKVELHKLGVPNDWSEFTLFRIIWREEDRNLPLPLEFIYKMRAAIHTYYGRPGKDIIFRVQAGETMEEIEQSKRNWDMYCRQYSGD